MALVLRAVAKTFLVSLLVADGSVRPDAKLDAAEVSWMRPKGTSAM